MATPLTVAMCTYNPRPDLISRAIRSVVAQMADLGGAAEFLIVDNQSERPVADADYIRGLPIELLREPQPGLAAAKAAAIRRSRGDVIVFVDDDNVLAPGYLRSAIAEFQDPRLGVLGGRVEPEYEAPPPAWLDRFETQLAIRRHPPGRTVETIGLPYTDDFPVGAGCAVRRSVALAYLADADQHGRIEGRKGTQLSAGEDLDLDFFALSSGYTLRISGALALTHVIPSERCTEEYVSRLVVSGLRSSLELDRKWRARLGGPVFPYLHSSALQIHLRSLIFGLLSPLSPVWRIKRRTWETIGRLRAVQPMNASDA